MAISKANFVLDRVPEAVGANYLVTGSFTGPTSYTNGGEVLTNALALAVFGFREVLFLSFSPPMQVGSAVLCGWDGAPVAGTSQGSIRFFNVDQSHSHVFAVSGGVTLASNDHLGAPGGGGVIGQPGVGGNITAIQGTAGAGSGVQNSAATAAAADASPTTNFAAYTCRFMALGR